MEHNVPEEHSSEVGGSTAARRIGCPDSRVLEKKMPNLPGSVYAREGTALHEMMAIILKDDLDEKQIEKMLPFTFEGKDMDGDKVLEEWSHTIDEETWEDVGAPALAMFDNFVDGIMRDYDSDDFRMLIEVRGAFPGIPGAFGTSDVLWRCGAAAGCWDWKFGRNPVDALDNKQLKFYMNTAIYEHPDMFEGVEDFILCISQPLVNKEEPSEDVITMQDLIDFREELQTAMTSSGIAEGPWCKYARCAAICPLKTGKAARLGELIGTMKNLENTPSHELTEDFDLATYLAEALELKDAAEEWAKAVTASAQALIDGGGTVPGWKTVDKRSSGKDWTKEDNKVRGALSRRGLKIDQYAPRKTISPPQAIKLLAKDGKDLPDNLYAARPSSGTTLTREGDPRPSAKSAVQRTKDLAAALSKHHQTETETK